MSVRQKLLALAAASLLSVGGIAHIQSSEGFHRTAYPDPGTGGAPWTICFGHTGPEVYPGLTVSEEQCWVWFYEDVKVAEDAVRRRVTQPMKQGEYDSHVSFVYNVGEDQYRNSTLLRLFNHGNRAASCNQFPRWIYANKQVLNGLRTRRYREQSMCHQPGPYIYVP